MIWWKNKTHVHRTLQTIIFLNVQFSISRGHGQVLCLEYLSCWHVDILITVSQLAGASYWLSRELKSGT